MKEALFISFLLLMFCLLNVYKSVFIFQVCERRLIIMKNSIGEMSSLRGNVLNLYLSSA